MKKIFDVTAPSGRVCKITLPSMQTYIIGNQFPTRLLELLLEAEQSEGVGDVEMKELTVKEQVAMLKFSGELVRRAMVEPKIVNESPKDGEILFSDLDDEDFKFLVGYVKNGGIEGKNLENFPKRSAKGSRSRVNGR